MLDEQSRQGVTTTSSGSTVMDFLATQRIPTPSPSPTPIAPAPDEEEYYSSWSLFLVCMLLILSLWTSYYLQIKRIRAVNETVVSIFAGMFVGLIVRLAPGTMIRDMLVSTLSPMPERAMEDGLNTLDRRSNIRSFSICCSRPSSLTQDMS